MEPAFEHLPREKQLRILNAAMKVFARNDYRHASTDDIAAQAGVNPNTMQKALSELERDGLVYSQRTAGRFITEDENMIVKMRNELAQDRIQAFFEGMSRLGFTREETMEMLNRAAQEQQQKGD